MMTRWIQSKQLNVEHPRKKRHRLPIVHIRGIVHQIRGECPLKSFCGKSFKEVGILIDVAVIIVINEIKVPDRPESGDGEKRQEEQDEAETSPGRKELSAFRRQEFH